MKCKMCCLAIIMMGFFIIETYGLSKEEQTQESIVEEVEVNWWQVPVFAIDKDNNAVIDLNDTEIQIWMNDQPVKEFVFYKRSFDLVQKKEIITGKPKEEVKEKVREEKVTPLKKQVIFLLFDTAFSKAACTMRSKKISKEIVNKSAPGTQFVLLSIEPFKGLNYIYGPSSNKNELLQNIEKYIIPKFNEPDMEAKSFKIDRINDEPENKPPKRFSSKYDPEMPSDYYLFQLRKSYCFFNSFENLYLTLNSINDNKFVYYFSEGIPKDTVLSLFGGRAMYNTFTKRSAQLLGRSGAVLFMVNPMGVHDGAFLTTKQAGQVFKKNGFFNSNFSNEEKRSGETQVRYLARESGGKYMEGVNEEILESLEQMHRAYYEISFPDIPGLKGNIRNITVKSKRKGITLHTLRSLEKTKPYNQLNDIEKELVALNLIVGNPLFKSKASSEPVSVTRIKKHNDQFIYHIQLPKDFMDQPLDLYKCWIKENHEVISMERETLKPAKRKLKISFKIKGKQYQELKPYFVFINSKTEGALVRAMGDDWIEENDQHARTIQSKRELMPQPISKKEFQNLLTNAANYCQRLKESAFHFYCKEKITELKDHLFSIPKSKKAKQYWNDPSGIQVQLKDLSPLQSYKRETKKGNTREENRYRFGYRLLKKGKQITEERQWLSASDKEKLLIDADLVVKPTAFFTQRAIFAPITMLSDERQSMYDFRYLGDHDYKGRNAAVIDAIPKYPEKEHPIYGKIWIDREDYSVLKIEANPYSIKGYKALKELEKKLKTNLQLSLEIEFDHLYDGLRFPTHVSLAEYYKGGRYIYKIKGPKGWLRTRTTFLYNDYQFFNVNVDVKIENSSVEK